MEPIFLSLDDLLESHAEQIAAYGGSDGIRDLGLLQSALAQPAATFDGSYLHADLFDMAAAYLYHIVLTIRSWTATSESAWKRHWCFWPSMATRSKQRTRISSTWFFERRSRKPRRIRLPASYVAVP